MSEKRGSTELSPRYGLTSADLTFVHLVRYAGVDRVEAFYESYPDETVDGDGEPLKRVKVQRMARQRWELQRIQKYVEYLETPIEQLAYDVEKEQVVLGTRGERARAAERIIARREQEAAKNAADRYMEILAEVGAKVVTPVKHGERVVEVALADLMPGGRARVELPLAAKLRLLRRAGAPWSDKNPSARLSALQQEILDRREKIMVLHGGSGVGKSCVGGQVGFCALSVPNTRIGILGATYDHAESEFRYLYEGFLKCWGPDCATRLSYKCTRTHHDMEIRTIWGSTVVAHSLDKDSGMQMYGKEFDLVILAEGSRVSADVFWRAIFRGLQRRAMRMALCDEPEPDEPADWYSWETGRALIATTPDGYEGAGSAVWDRALELSQKRPDRLHYGSVPFQESIYLREADCLENPDYDRDAYRAAEATLPPDVFAEQYQGKRVRRAGLVLREFDYSRHVRPLPDAEALLRMRFALGMDTGKHFAAVLLGMEPSRRTWCLGEVYTEAQTVRDDCTEIRRMVVERLGPVANLSMDPWRADPEALASAWELLLNRLELFYCDDACQSQEDFLEELEAPILFEKPEQMGSISQVNMGFRNDELLLAADGSGEPLCPNLAWELQNWKWRVVKPTSPTMRAQLKPEDKNDHACDALRYAYVPLRKAGPLEVDDAPPLSMEEAYKRQVEARLLNPMAHGDPGRNMGEFIRSIYH